MKKVFMFMTISLVVFLLSACTSKVNSVTLSVNNYETYLDLSIFFSGEGIYISSENGVYYSNVKGEVEVRPTSSGNIFVDVVFQVQIVGRVTRLGYDFEIYKTYNKIIFVYLDLDGYGRGTEVVNIKDAYNFSYIGDYFFDSYELISVSGIVKQPYTITAI